MKYLSINVERETVLALGAVLNNIGGVGPARKQLHDLHDQLYHLWVQFELDRVKQELNDEGIDGFCASSTEYGNAHGLESKDGGLYFGEESK
jgi:hypothetical protein